MANEKKIRLLAIARQLNVGSGTLVDFLNNQGYTVEGGNQLLDDSMIASVEKEFGKGKMIEKINIKEKIKTKNETVSLDDINKTKQPESADSEYEKSELLIKTNIVEKKIDHVVLNTPKIVGKIDLDAIGKRPAAKAASTPKSQSHSIKQDVKPVEKIEVKVSDNSNNSKQQPAVDIKKPEVAKEVAPKVETAVVVDKEKIEKMVDPTGPVDITKTFDDRRAESSEDLFRINNSDLTGPKIIGKVDLSSFEKKKTDNSDKNKKNKRKRIKKDNKVDINDPKNSSQAAQKAGNKPAGAPNHQGAGGARNHQAGGAGGNQRPHSNNNASRPGGNSPHNKNGKFAPKTPAAKAVVNDDDVQKQIKDTLARLTSKGNKTKSSKYRKDKRDAVSARASEEMERQEAEKSILQLTEFVTVSDLTRMMDVSVTEVITACMNLGLMVSINQRLDAEAIVIVAEEFGYKVEFVSVEIQEQVADEVDNEEDLITRSPIVAVMGHVDHGKTSLLDFIRKANVIAGEAGGITQHIGAYSVKVNDDKRITFLDTPGHEAFTAMRARGAKVTDVAIIIIAADDSVMPQTVEAINHASAAGVPIIFAINKIDKPGANPDKIREQLSAMNYLVEDWGGKYQCQEIAAKSGLNVDLLLEKIILESEMLELKANPNRKANGVIIESTLDKGRGYVSTVLVENGTLKIGDVMLSGVYSGRVKAMFNERGSRVTEALPATPVLVLGLNGAPQAGDTFNVMDDDKQARDVANKREQLQRIQGLKTQKHITLDEIGRRIAIGNFQELNVIVKGDVDGSVEALTDSLIKQSKEEVQVNVIHKAVGQISESDVLLAAASNAVIIGFQVRPSSSARKLADKEEIEIRLYSIIYDAINDIKDAIVGMLAPVIKEEIICSVEIMEVFKITKVGNIAGCLVREGKITRNTKIRIIRDGIVVHSGKLGSLKRYKDDVKEVTTNMECGLNIDGYNDIKAGDIVEGYEEVEVKRT